MFTARTLRRLRIRVGTPAVAAFVVFMGLARTAAASEPGPALPPTGRECAALEAALTKTPEPRARLAVADCHAHHGRSASAWTHYRQALAAARATGATELEELARRRARALEPELSYLTVQTWKGQEVRVTQNGAPLDPATFGTAIPLDAGRHVIEATAPGKRGWSKRIELGSHGDHVTVSVPVLPDDVQLLHSELAASAPAGLPSTPDEPRSGAIQRTLGLVAGAVGIAGVATAALFGVKAAADWSDAKAQCQPYPYCGDEGARLARDAKQSAMISTLGFATGLVGLSSGALLWFTAETPQRPALTVGLGRVELRGQL